MGIFINKLFKAYSFIPALMDHAPHPYLLLQGGVNEQNIENSRSFFNLILDYIINDH